MRKVGVTGAAGFIGSHLCDRLLAEGYEVVGVDDLSYGSIENVAPFLDDPKFRFEQLDCTRRTASCGWRSTAATRSCTWRRRRSRATAARLDARSERRRCQRRGHDRAWRWTPTWSSPRPPTSTATPRPPFPEDGDLVLGPPTTSAGRTRSRSSTTSTSGSRSRRSGG